MSVSLIKDIASGDLVCTPRAQHKALMAAAEAALVLAKAEEAYRSYHDLCGDSAMETGHAWDFMRRAGDKLRTALAALRAAGIELEEKT